MYGILLLIILLMVNLIKLRKIKKYQKALSKIGVIVLPCWYPHISSYKMSKERGTPRRSVWRQGYARKSANIEWCISCNGRFMWTSVSLQISLSSINKVIKDEFLVVQQGLLVYLTILIPWSWQWDVQILRDFVKTKLL